MSLDVPTKLKKELNTVLTLKADLDNSNKVLQLAQATIEKGNVSPGIMDALASLECGHARLVTKAEALYLSLNVHDQFPELKNISLNFVQILLMARDLKMNIHKKAVGTFFEWDKLDRAVGGKDKPLGVSQPPFTEPTIKDIIRYQTSSTDVEGDWEASAHTYGGHLQIQPLLWAAFSAS